MQVPHNIKLTIQYDGTHYHGWQAHFLNDVNSIQGCIENALFQLVGHPVSLIGSGRTDSGVHAIAQVANFKTSSNMPKKAFIKGLNSILPKDIRIIGCAKMPYDFHSRFSARCRTYCYVISTDEIESAFSLHQRYYIKRSVDVNYLKKALAYIEGTHDFKNLCSVDYAGVSTIRHIFSTDVCQDGNLIIIYIRANAFLKRMIRIIIGSVLDHEYHNKPLDQLLRVMQVQDRSLIQYKVAPAMGLFLCHIQYEHRVSF